jgi:tripartite ATP-independent transporter DctP family solute receptor
MPKAASRAQGGFMKASRIIVSMFIIALATATVVFAAGQTEGATVKPAEVRVFKLADDGLPDMPVGVGLRKLAEEVEKRSNGAMKIEIYFNAQLGQEQEVLDNIKFGTIDMMKANCGNMAGHVPTMNAFTLPFIFTDEAHSWRVFNGPVGDIVKKEAETKGYKILTFFEEGARNIYSRKGFVQTPKDLAGLKIRIMGAASIQDGFKALSASPTPMSFGEVYTGLSQGVIDAAENAMPSINGLKFYEVAPFVTETAHLRIPAAILMGVNQWNSLTKEQQQIFVDSANVAREFQRAAFQTLEQESLKQILAKGGKYQSLTAEQRLVFSQMVAPVYEKYKGVLGKDIIEGILAAR